ncbi:DUF3667 domain-containing protein [Flavobacterium sp. 25HG05S-40]|uniref:DUF3667 domain-containing protein n=1 Tax=Flavobacterium sp. 25HG05S-40 TaxID=3458682 RepID=UPI004043D5F5
MNQHLCKNCEHSFAGNFCSNCGQKTNTVRLNWTYLKDEANYTILHFNKGFLYTIRELFTRPGDTIREFLEGKRVKHYKPILLVFVLAGINGYLASQLDIKETFKEFDYSNNMNKREQAAFMTEYMKCVKWAFGHWSLMEIFALPIVSLVSWISFRKWGYNFIENVIINSFASGQRLIFSIFTSITYLILPSGYMGKFSVFATIITFGLTIWTYASLYKQKEGSALMFRIALFILLLFVMAIILIIIFSILFVIYLKNSGKI